MFFCRFLFLFLLIGCSDNLMVKVQNRVPNILIHPEAINFGNFVSGQESGEESFAIINTGEEDLYVSQPTLFDGSKRFNIDDLDNEILVPPGELIDIWVYYVPETYEHNGAYIEVRSNDEDTPAINVLLEGYGDAPVMIVTPDKFDYGDISIGCDNEERITIRNDGNLDLEIQSVTQMVTQPSNIIMEYGSLPEPPWILSPEQEVDFLVSYVPTDIGTDESLITISGNDPKNPSEEVIQYGDGDVEQWYSQQHMQEEIPVLDVLWVIDNSGSMMPFQQTLADNIDDFINVFLAANPDFHMAVITTDNPSFSTIIDNTTTSPETVLSLLVQVGVNGSGTEKGIDMSVSSLSSSAYAGPGGDFFRLNSTLVVIYVSDEPNYMLNTWQNHITFFDSIKPTGLFVPYAVIGDVPNGCDFAYNSYTRHASPGYGYYDIVDHYGGSWYSICATDWGVQLQDLANQLTERRMFELDESDPIETTIKVYVNGQESTGWVYDATINGIIFNEDAIPSEGKTITIEYATWGCE